jgi:hypothetical protein
MRADALAFSLDEAMATTLPVRFSIIFLPDVFTGT